MGFVLLQLCAIDDCGELQPGDDDGTATNDDGTGDVYADWPDDSDIDFKDVSVHPNPNHFESLAQIFKTPNIKPNILDYFIYMVLKY